MGMDRIAGGVRSRGEFHMARYTGDTPRIAHFDERPDFAYRKTSEVFRDFGSLGVSFDWPLSFKILRMNPLRLAVLISGGGSTLTNLLDRIDAGEVLASVELVLASRLCDGVGRSTARGHSCEVVSPKTYPSAAAFSEAIFDRCRAVRVDLVVLGGFLSRIEVPTDFEGRVMNIHPSLIPAFCGQGMYGHHVHEAVIARGCKVSGCTVHLVDNEYDHGPILVQQVVPVLDGDDADALAKRVFAAECEAYPEAIRRYQSQLKHH